MPPTRFNLGWYVKDVPRAETYLCYVLVPDWLGILAGEMIFDRINWCGAPLSQVRASAAQLASPRTRDDTEGCPHLVEARLIRLLQARATQAGHILPEILPSTTFRRWSGLRLTDEQRTRLLLAGGIHV